MRAAWLWLAATAPWVQSSRNDTDAKKKKCFYDPKAHATKCRHADGSVWTSSSSKQPLLPLLASPAEGDGGTLSSQAGNSGGRGHGVARRPALNGSAPAAPLSASMTSAAAAAAASVAGLPRPDVGEVTCGRLEACGGVNLAAAIDGDLAPWRARGGITRADVEAAASWKVLQNPYTHLNSKGWCRVTIVGGRVHASHIGQGQGSRDGVMMLVLLELVRRFPALPDVDVVLYTEDRARLPKERYPHWDKATGSSAGSGGGKEREKPLPFALSFARHPGFLDVAVPDPSFFGWPEMGVNPHWQLEASAQASLPWQDRSGRIHWRGGMRRSGRLREALVECAHRARDGGSGPSGKGGGGGGGGVGAWMDVEPRTSANWEHPMAVGMFKLPLFIQGEGYTSNKQRVLTSGSCPVFAELTEHDT